MNEHLENIKTELEGLSAEEIVKWMHTTCPGEAVFSTSFGMEDQVLTHFVFANEWQIDIFTLDTGRLFNETYAVWSSTLDRYKKRIRVYYPNTSNIEQLISEKGPYSFYESTDNRKECCYIRKVEPLQRALKGYRFWITGIRAEQSGNRIDMPQVEWDNVNKIIKIHPLLKWTFEDVQAAIKAFNIPYNPLHDKGFVSIGCQPCTRAVKEGEDFRAGRWWWEDNSKKECGLHSK